MQFSRPGGAEAEDALALRHHAARDVAAGIAAADEWRAVPELFARRPHERLLHGNQFREANVGIGSRPGLDERQMYGSPTRPAGFGNEFSGLVGWTRPVAVGHDARFDAEKPSFGRLNSLNRPDAVTVRLKGDGSRHRNLSLRAAPTPARSTITTLHANTP